jgi:hypothetical protein
MYDLLGYADVELTSLKPVISSFFFADKMEQLHLNYTVKIQNRKPCSSSNTGSTPEMLPAAFWYPAE